MLHEAFTFERLLHAHNLCRCNKQHKRDTIIFEVNLSQNLTELSKSLLNFTYKLGEYKQFYIFEPKKRNIEALSYKDRVVLMALTKNIIAPKLDKKLIYDNVACRKNKGTLFGLKRLNQFLHSFYNIHKNNQGYFLKCDIKKYFQSINHNVLKELLLKANFDAEELSFLNMIIDSRNKKQGVGLPIGNQTSQWFALYYLNMIDRLIKEKLKIRYYVRYMDDMILVHESKEYLKYCKQEIEKVCKEKLLLELNHKTQISKLSNGIDFLGFRNILLDNGKVIRLLRLQAKIKLKKRIKLMSKYKKIGLINNAYIKIRLNSYKAHLNYSHSNKIYRIFVNKYKI
ncbi:MAG: RNA-directed DNA polymerase [Clostridiales bacterium]|nr:RNA-directed DNA polymerase [Clostridiales bacterium]